MLKKLITKGIQINGLKVHKVYTIFGLKFKFCVIKTKKSLVNKYLKNITPYNVVPHKIWEVEDKNSILKLDWNESTLPPSPKVKEVLLALTQKADFYNLYPKTKNDEILNLLSEYTNLDKDYIQYFASSDSIHEYISKMYIGESDKVLIEAPSYDNFRLTAQANGAEIFFSEAKENFKFDEKGLEKDIQTIKPSFVYIINPNNPTGQIHSKKYIENLLLKYPNIMFLIDEAYYEFAQSTVAELVTRYENILVTRTLSKAFGLANFRFGYLLGSKDNIKSINTIRNPKNISTFTQVAATAALSDIEYMKNYVLEVSKSREYFINELKLYSQYLEPFDSVSNFVLVKFKDFKLKSAIFNHLQKHNIFVRNLLQSKRLYNCLRFTIGTKEQMQKVLECINSFFKEQNQTQTSDKIALFDFCGTIVDFQSGNPYIFHVVENQNDFMLDAKNCFRKLKLELFRKFNKNYPDKMDILKLLTGFDKKYLEEMALDYYIKKVRPHFYPKVINKMLALKNDGYKIYVVSGGYTIYLQYFMQEFGLDGVIATDIEFDENGKCLGRFEGKDCVKTEKLNRLQDLLNKNLYKEIIGFTDSSWDIPMLEICNKKYAVTSKKEEKWMQNMNCEIINV